jgi:sugar (pentulose or hexulose) kinase
MPVAILADAGNVGVRGAVLAAQAANDERIEYVLPDFSPVDETLNPDTLHLAHYDKKYLLFRDTYLALKSIFARMS